MSVSAAQGAAFYQEAARQGSVWGVRDESGFPAPKGREGHRAMPFWSLRSRAELVVRTVPAFAGFQPIEIPLEEFRSRWLPGLRRDGLRVGVNWSGERAVGYDVPAEDVERNLATARAHLSSETG